MQAKTKTKALVLSLCAVLLVAVSVFTTLAFLKSSASVKNTFTVGKVNITLDEAKVDEYGNADATANRVKENSYKLIPGHSYIKDPTVHFAAGSEESYLFVKVENGLSDIETKEAAKKIESQIKANGWTGLTDVAGVYWRKVDANNTAAAMDIRVFSEFELDGDAEVSGYADAKICVTAYAIQADGFDTAAAAWTAGNF